MEGRAVNVDLDWCWESLRPWQILHSTLAEQEFRRGDGLDVWEVIDETLAAADLSKRKAAGQDGSRGKRPAAHEEEAAAWWWGQDGEFWRHGGVMEGRIREWLVRKREEEEEAATARCRVVQQREEHAGSNEMERNAAATTGREEGEEAREGGEMDEGEVAAVVYAQRSAAAAVCSAASVWIPDEEEEEEEEEWERGNGELGSDDEGEVCPVCLEQLVDSTLPLPCRHTFHAACLSPWLLQRPPAAACPCCRAPVPADLLSHVPPAPRHPPPAPAPAPDIMCLIAGVEAALDIFGLGH